jgi:hypothetical protein
MKCNHFKEKLSLLIDNQLDADDAESVRKHLEECDSCRAYHGNLLRLGQMVDGFDLSENSRYWELQKDKVLERIDEEEREKVFGLKARRRRDKYYKFIAVAASLALVAIVSIYESKEIRQTQGLFDDKTEQRIPTQIVKSESKPDKPEEPDELKVDSKETVLKESVKAVESETHPTAVDEKPVEYKKVTEGQSASVADDSDDSKDKIESPEAIAEPSSLKLGEASGASNQGGLLQAIEPSDISYQADKMEPMSLKSSPVQTEQSPNEAKADEFKLKTALKSQEIGKNPDRERTALLPGGVEYDQASSSEEKSLDKKGKNIWQIRLDSLEAKYDGIYSPHYIESAAKGKTGLSRDSLDTIILEIAETCFQVGILTQDAGERELMMGKLHRLADNGGPEVVEKIQNYIALLLSAD